MKIKVFAFVVYFVALLALTAHAQSLDDLSSDDRSSIELACINAKVEGPATYHACLNRQLRQLGGEQAPSLDGLSSDDRSSIELACINAKVEGPATYHACLNRQFRQLGGGQAPSLDGLSSDDRSGIELACINAKVEGPATYHTCLNGQLVLLGNTSSSTALAGVKSPPQSGVPNTAAPSRTTPAASPLCAENGSCYGDISARTGLPKTVPVHGYYRANGTYVQGYYRSK
jgi:hypothetical protein